MVKGDMAKIDAFHNRCLRKIYRIFWPNKISDGLQQCCPRNQTQTTKMARACSANAPRGTEMNTTWKKETRTAKDDMATISNGRAERDGAVLG